jgi:methyl-accepting chemotaxis protein
MPEAESMSNAETQTLEERLKFIDFGAEDAAALRAARPVLAQNIERILVKFYGHIEAFPDLMAMFGGPAGIAHARAAQAEHWLRLFESSFDSTYVERVQRIGTIHSKIGLEPRWYMAGYALAFGELQAAVSEAYRWKHRQRAAALRALTKAIMLDMDYAVTVYIERSKVQTADSIAGAVESIRAAASEISQGSNDLARRTERQASALQETVATMAEISASVVNNAGNSEKARKLAAEAQTRAETGGEAVTRVVDAMTLISTSSARIAQISQAMEEISFQTKLLALNAAVEAARAGDSGKGFAVVAHEVRALADRSREASQQIRNMIDESAREVGRGVEVAGAAGEALNSIIAIVQGVAEIAPEIAAGSREQSRSIVEIKKALADLDTATQQNAALVEQNAASVASLADQAHRIVDVLARYRGADAVATVVKPKPAAPSAAARATAAQTADWDEEF